MRRAHATRDLEPLVGEDTRYCALCEAMMLFEQIGADTDEPGEWICVACGSAVFVDPPVQVTRTA